MTLLLLVIGFAIGYWHKIAEERDKREQAECDREWEDRIKHFDFHD